MPTYTGFLLDLYDDPQDGLVLWLLSDDGTRLRLRQDFPVTFYAAGPAKDLRLLWQYLESQPLGLSLRREERVDLFAREPVTVLACEVKDAYAQPQLFQRVSQMYPQLTYYDADLNINLRFAALHNTFPLARCRVEVSGQNRLEAIETITHPWDLDPEPAPISILSIEPDVSPYHSRPRQLEIRLKTPEQAGLPGTVLCRLPLAPERALIANLRSLLLRHDPDLILSSYGDTWIFPLLLEITGRLKLGLPLNRDPGRAPACKPERSYFTYGQIVHRGQQYHLFGRWHIDRCNAMLFHDYGMEGVMELARVTSLPMQSVARVSPGSGISSMQILTALRTGVLVPWHKQQAERPKDVLDLLRADQGGLVYQPIPGLHAHVAEVDFVSMYPSIMERFNISPETVGAPHAEEEPNPEEAGYPIVPQLGIRINPHKRGLVPETLKPLLEKRIALKQRMAGLPRWDPRQQQYKARASAHKWLLVTCFGYLGYKNARFGRIESHEAVTAYGRECLLLAKEAAEEMGCTVIHLYVDGMWAKGEGLSTPEDFQVLLERITESTGLPIALDGVYKWVAFLPSRVDERVPVANRYFGAFQDGSLKIRGIEARRGDTCPFIARAQVEMLERMAKEEASALPVLLPELYGLLRRKIWELKNGSVKPQDLLMSLKLSRTLEEYKTPSPAARAAAQLEAAGKTLRPGDKVRFLYMLGEPGVHAWDLPEHPDLRSLNIERYVELLLRAGATVVQPLGVSEETLKMRVLHDAVQLREGRLARPKLGMGRRAATMVEMSRDRN